MSLPLFTAVQFRRPMERGLNKPFLVIGENQANQERQSLVVKSTAGFSNRTDAIVKELFALLFAKKLGINVPEAVLVGFPDGFDQVIQDQPIYADLVRNSPGWNLATVHLGNDWKTWIDSAPPRSIEKAEIESAYCFDAMVQNSDREAGNPNLMWRGDELALLDFDRAFAYLRTNEASTRPWRRTLIKQNLPWHCLHKHLPDLSGDFILGQEIWENFLEWRLSHPEGSLTSEIGDQLEDRELDLPRLEVYLSNMATDCEDFFRYLTDVSRR